MLGSFSGYRIISPFNTASSGAFSTFRAIRENDQKRVLIKFPNYKGPPGPYNKQLEVEFEIERSLSSRFILQPIALNTEKDRAALVFADEGGVPLKTILGSPFPVRSALKFGVQLATSLEEIHSKGLIYKNLTSSNIIYFSSTKTIKITDLSSSTPLLQEFESMHEVPLMEDSLPYISPEQTGRLNQPLDYRTDLYSLGIVLYEMLTGRTPFRGTNPLEWTYAHIALTPSFPPEVSSRLPKPVLEIILKLLNKSPVDRYQSAYGLRKDLTSCLQLLIHPEKMKRFCLGRKDFSAKLDIPPKIYGRSREIRILKKQFEEATTEGVPRLILVSGASGSGKTSLVQELSRHITLSQGTFISGKFDQFATIPYLGIFGAVKTLIEKVRAESQEQRESLRKKLLASIGTDGPLLIDVIPELTYLIGEQKQTLDLTLSERKKRFLEAFYRFLSVFPTRGHPLVLFLDDLQWADQDSLELVTYLLTHSEITGILIIGAFREDSPESLGALLSWKKDLFLGETKPYRLRLNPLKGSHLAHLIRDTTRCNWPEAKSLAGLIQKKTAGNPYFVIEFIKYLYHQQLIQFDWKKRRWNWDLPFLEARSFSDNVVKMMIGTLQSLPPTTSYLMSVAACIGSNVDTKTLAIITGMPEGDIADQLWPAVLGNHLIKINSEYRFPHDWIQQACYLFMPLDRRKKIHLQIARNLLSQTPKGHVDAFAFEIANHFNNASDLITNSSERLQMIEANLLAGKKAKLTLAYSSALSYLDTGIQSLPKDSWIHHTNLTFELSFEKAEVEFMIGRMEKAKQQIKAILKGTRQKLHRAQAFRLLSDIQIIQGDTSASVQSILKALSLFGIHLSLHPSFKEVEIIYQEIQELIGTRSIEDLIDSPRMEDSDILMAMDILASLYSPAYLTDENLLKLHICEMVKLTLKHGISEAAVVGYGWFGLVLIDTWDLCEQGYRFANLGLNLMKKYNFASYRAKIYFIMEMASYWICPISETIENIQNAYRSAIETGDQVFACFSCNHVITDLLLVGTPLDKVYEESGHWLDYTRKVEYVDMENLIIGMQRFIQNLRGQTKNISTFDGPDFSEKEYEKRLKEGTFTTGILKYFTIKMKARCITRNYSEAILAGETAKKVFWTSFGHPQRHEFVFYSALSLAATLNSKSEKLEEHLSTLTQCSKKLVLWAQINPSTFLSTSALLNAEIERIQGHFNSAMKLYEVAISSAKENYFNLYEGLSYEFAARFYFENNLPNLSTLYLSQAIRAYSRWGASGKVNQLSALFPQSVPPEVDFSRSISSREIELLSIIQASQTISEEIELDLLIRNLIRIMIQKSGAESGTLLLLKNKKLGIQAVATAVEQGVSIEMFDSLSPTSEILPLSILNTVEQSLESIVLQDARSSCSYGSDPYIQQRKTLSIACIPILRQKKILAVLYLEHNRVSGLFSPSNVQTIRLMAAQAAISLENSQLYGTVAEQQNRFQSILDNSSAIIFIKDVNMRYVLTNRQFETLLKIKKVDTIGKTDRDLFVPELAKTYETNDKIVLSSLRPKQFEEEVMLTDGLHTYLALKFPLISQSGICYGLCGIVTDISDRKRMEQQRALLLKERENDIKCRDTFISIASHELRTPLTPISLQVEFLTRRLDQLEKSRFPEFKYLSTSLSLIRTQLKRLEDLIEDMLDVSRMQTGKFPVCLKEGNLSVLAEETLDEFKNQYSIAGHEMKIKISPDLWCRFDPVRLREVFSNLMSNAIKFGEGEQIVVMVDKSGNSARIRVIDHGVGINDEDQRKIFNLFTRFGKTTHYPGLGVGLYIVHEIVKAHNGTIRVQSKLGKRTEMTVELPLLEGGEEKRCA